MRLPDGLTEAELIEALHVNELEELAGIALGSGDASAAATALRAARRLENLPSPPDPAQLNLWGNHATRH